MGIGALLRTIRPHVYRADLTTQDTLELSILLGVSVVLSLAAGYICATIAPRKLALHVLILGVIQFAIGIAVQTAVWDRMPLWYHLIFLALVVPGHLAEGALRARRING